MAGVRPARQGGDHRPPAAVAPGRLAALDRQIDYPTVADPDALEAVLAAQRPWWPPGTATTAPRSAGARACCCAASTPKAAPLGRYFADEVAAPLDVEYYIGLPAAVPDDRVATRHIKFVHRPTMGWRVLAPMGKPRSLLIWSGLDLPVASVLPGMQAEAAEDLADQVFSSDDDVEDGDDAAPESEE